jgi:DNA gyrase subunit B
VANHEDSFSTSEKLESVLKDLNAWIAANPALGVTEIKGKVTVEEGKPLATINTTRYADRLTTKISAATLKASEWIELMNLWGQIQSVSKLPIAIEMEGQDVSFENYKEFYEHIMEGTKKGYYIQRYKGLGEMNPEQLWSTTLDPNTRTLLKVTIDDAVAADETFSLLMGELVEPRRKFIQDNALLAGELDV